MIAEKLSIIQIIPADGWQAVWENVDGTDGVGYPDEITAPLVCWALVEDPDGNRFVTGLDAEPGDAGFVAGDNNFKGYLSPNGDRKEGSAPLLE